MRSFNSQLADNTLYKETLPYERFMKSGPESLTDAELLAVIIRTGTNNCSPVDIAKKVMNLGRGKEKGLNCLFNLSMDELMGIHGVGQVKAIMLKCVAELAKRMSFQKTLETMDCSNSDIIADYYMERLRHEEQEKAILLCLNNKLKLIEESTLAIGTVNSASLSPRDIFMKALRCGASYMVLLHNHPAGDPTPSKQDILITNRIRESGLMLDIILRDHIIIGDKAYCSLENSGLLWQ